MLSILSYNVWCGDVSLSNYNLLTSKRLIIQLHNVARLAPDIIGFQEVYDPKVEHRLRSLLGDKYDFASADVLNSSRVWIIWLLVLTLFTVLVMRIFSFLFNVVLIGTLLVLVMGIHFSGLGQAAIHGRPGLLVAWKHDRLRLNNDSPPRFYSFRQLSMDWRSLFIQRGYQVIDLVLTGYDKFSNPNNKQICPLRLIHTHLDASGNSRLSQAHNLVEHAIVNDGVCVLLGDLNDTPDSPTLQFLFQQGWTNVDTQPTRGTWQALGVLDRWLYGPIQEYLDYILIYKHVPSEFQSSKITRVFDYSASDHLGVLLTISNLSMS